MGVEMARRSGASTVLGVGSGSAIDLAKVVASSLSRQNDVELVLAPATVGAAMASMSVGSMVLSQEEEALLPPEFIGSGSLVGSLEGVDTTVILDEYAMAVPLKQSVSSTGTARKGSTATVVDAALGAISLCIDAAVSSPSMIDAHRKILIDKTIEHSLCALSDLDVQSNGGAAKSHAIAAVVHAGQLICFGNMHKGLIRQRSVPIALASSLLPRYFPHGHILTFFASMLPGICATLPAKHGCTAAVGIVASSITGGGDVLDLVEWAESVSKNAEIPTMASLAEGAPDIHAMMGRLDANAALLNCEDASYDYLEEVMQRSLSR